MDVPLARDQIVMVGVVYRTNACLKKGFWTENLWEFLATNISFDELNQAYRCPWSILTTVNYYPSLNVAKLDYESSEPEYNLVYRLVSWQPPSWPNRTYQSSYMMVLLERGSLNNQSYCLWILSHQMCFWVIFTLESWSPGVLFFLLDWHADQLYSMQHNMWMTLGSFD